MLLLLLLLFKRCSLQESSCRFGRLMGRGFCVFIGGGVGEQWGHRHCCCLLVLNGKIYSTRILCQNLYLVLNNVTVIDPMLCLCSLLWVELCVCRLCPDSLLLMRNRNSQKQNSPLLLTPIASYKSTSLAAILVCLQHGKSLSGRCGRCQHFIS